MALPTAITTLPPLNSNLKPKIQKPSQKLFTVQEKVFLDCNNRLQNIYLQTHQIGDKRRVGANAVNFIFASEKIELKEGVKPIAFMLSENRRVTLFCIKNKSLAIG